MSGRQIPYGRQSISEDDIKAVVEVLRGDWLTCGPDIESFEGAFAEYVGAKHAVSYSSGTSALHGAMAAAEVGEGDGVVVPPLTFAATANSVVYRGARPIFGDISRETLCLDPAAADRAANFAEARIKAFGPVSFAGYPADIDAFKRVAKRYGAAVIEDAAHALGARRGGRMVGAEADMTTFSFHPVKHITTCEGGMVTTNDDELARRLRLFRAHGITKSPSEFVREYAGGWDNDMLELGYNYRLSDVACALGESQLRRVEQFVARRREIAALYRRELAGAEGIVLPPDHDGHSYHLFAIQVAPSDRRRVFDELRAAGIGVQVHYIPVYYHTFYREHFPQRHEDFPISEQVCGGEISLPIYYGLSDEDVRWVAQKLKDIVKR